MTCCRVIGPWPRLHARSVVRHVEGVPVAPFTALGPARVSREETYVHVHLHPSLPSTSRPYETPPCLERSSRSGEAGEGEVLND